MNKKILSIATIILILDQAFKIIMEASLATGKSIVIIKDFFNLSFTNNYGAAWSLFNNQVPLLIVFSSIALFIIIRYMNTFKDNRRNTIAFGLLLGGVTGNLLDRLFLGYVRDFLAFIIFGYEAPIFNISDMAIFCGVALLILAIIKGEDNGNISPDKQRKN